MSGHSKWSTIKRKKGKEDAKRGNLFTKLIKEITVAARQGGGDPESNPRLRTAMVSAKAANMPHDNIERAIKKGTGELPGVAYEEVSYEGYGPGGVAIYIECLTDNKNRTVSEIRYILSKNGGRMADVGSVLWVFDKKGLVVIEEKNVDSEDRLMDAAISAGADDVTNDDGVFEIVAGPERLADLQEVLASEGFEIQSAEITMVPKSTVKLEGKDAVQMLRLMDRLEQSDDVQNVFANFDIDPAVMEEVG
ncbi:MAG: YebC/PmpR family DNA-binding transcriptional regulator [Candidatus Coatesbacteria bacterium]|nr:MAG: YebC/PmpR family DNA-binding transcriptional regulator [Candidatus Coatesbacteria bacterium]